MPARAHRPIPIQVELGRPLEQLISSTFLEDLRQAVDDRADAMLTELHLPTAAVTVQRSRARVILQVRVHGTVQPLPIPVLEPYMSRRAASPSPTRREQTADDGNTDAPGNDYGDLVASLSDLAWHGVARRPSCLLGPDHAARLPFPAWLRGATMEPASPDDVMGYLLDLGVRAPEPERLATQLAQAPDASVDLAETLFEEYRADVVELHLSPEAFRAMSGDAGLSASRVRVSDAIVDTRVQEQVASFAGNLRNRQGLQLPPVELVLASDLPNPGCAVRINEHLSLPMRLQPGSGQPGAKEPFATPYRPPSVMRLPRGLDRPATAPQDDLFIGALATALEAMQQELERVAYRLLGMSDVEYLLARLEAQLPALVHATLSQFSVTKLTRLLRALVWERTGLRDLATILDGLLSFAWVATQPRTSGVVFDERIVLPAPLPAEAANDLPYLLEGARALLAPMRTARWAKSRLLTFEDSLEHRLEQVQIRWATGEGPSTDARTLWEELEAAIRTVTRDAYDHALVTSAGARWITHALLTDNFPDLAVVACHEVGPDMPGPARVIRSQRRRSSVRTASPSGLGDRPSSPSKRRSPP